MREPKDISILIVDDEPALKKAIAFDFKRKGFKVFEASDGKEAFEIVKSQKLDVVLSDVRMPVCDGIELLDHIKAMNPEIPVVMFVTGFADITLDEAYNKGADAVFSKPFDRKALMSAVIRAVTPLEERLRERKSERLETDFEIEVQFPEFNLATKGKVLNIGRGGMYVALKENFPQIDAKAFFSIQFEQNSPNCIKGDGIVRWVRAQTSDAHPSGCGIEFEYLSDDCRETLVKLIHQLKMKAFIPKS